MQYSRGGGLGGYGLGGGGDGGGGGGGLGGGGLAANKPMQLRQLRYGNRQSDCC